MRKDIVLLDPLTQPVERLITAQDQASLGPGEWAQLDNLRVEKGLLSCRGGQSASLGTVMASASFRGIWTGFLWGSYTILVAVEVGGAVRVLKSTDMATWTEVTTSSTRFSTSGMVRFSVVPDPLTIGTSGYNITNTERLIMANGIDAPRCAKSSGSTCHIIADVISQQDMQPREVKVKILEFWGNLQDTISYTNSTGSKFAGADTGTAPNKQARITIDTTVTQGETVIVDTAFNGTVTASNVDRQVLIGLDTAYGPFWDKIKLEVGSSGGYTTVWDPANPGTYARPVPAFLDNSQRAIWIFPWNKLSAGVAYDRFRLTWAVASNQAPTADQIADIFLFGFTYGRDAFADYSIGVTNYCEDSATESSGTIFSTYQTQLLKDVGGPVLNDVKLPRSPLLRAVFFAPYQNVTANQKTAGVNKVNFYAKESGSSRYRFWYQDTTVAASAYVYGSNAGDVTYIFAGPDATVATDATPVNVYPEAYLPDAYNIAIPTASEVCWANNRLFVGKKKGTAQQLVISEFRNPFRCRRFVTFENGVPADWSATIIALGNETIQAIVPLAASTAGSSTIFIFTDQNIYAVSGQTTSQLSQLGRVANIGTLSPLSIASDKGTLYFVDNEMQVRTLANGGISSITRNLTDDKLKAVPAARRKWLGGTVYNDIYYLAYSESSSNNRALVWDMADGIWTTDTPAKSLEGLVTWLDSTSLRLIAIGLDGSDLKAYDYDKSSQAQDLGTTNITCTLEPYEIHIPSGAMFHVGRCKAMIDDVNSGTATIRRTYYPSGVYQETSLSLDVSTEHIYREDRIEGATVTGSGQPVGPRCRTTFSVPMQSQDKIRYLALEVTPLGGGQDRP